MTERKVRLVGSGPTNGVDPRYIDEVWRISRRIGTNHDGVLDAWWERSPVPTLEIWVWLDRDRVTYRTRRSASRMTAQVERSARSTTEHEDPAALACHDLTSLLNKVGEKLELGEIPAL